MAHVNLGDAFPGNANLKLFNKLKALNRAGVWDGLFS